MATIKENKNKDGKVISYRWRCCVGRNAAGRQEWETKTVPAPDGLTPKKALKAMQTAADQWEADLKAGRISRCKDTLGAFIENYWFPLAVEDGQHSQSTVDFYKACSRRIVAAMGDKLISKITPLDVDRFIAELRREVLPNGSHLSDKTIKHHYRTLSSIMGYAEQKGVIDRNPMARCKAPSVERKPVDFLSMEDAQRFSDALKTEPVRWQATMTVLLVLGLRRGECCGLQWRDIDFKKGTVSVQRNAIRTSNGTEVNDHLKTEGSRRVVPLPAPVASVLRSWQMEQAQEHGILLPNAFVFSDPLDPYSPCNPQSLTRWMQHFTSRHDLPNVSPHDLRHTAATRLIAAGVGAADVAAVLGHADPATTLRFYAGANLDSMRAAFDRLEKVSSMA